MNSDEYNDYIETLFRAARTLNRRMGAKFSKANLVLRCFQTENQQEVFEQFCRQYFPDRLTDRYKEDGYFNFHASAFVGEGENSVDGILLRTDVERTTETLYHILLHELAHIFCIHNEFGGANFFKCCCMGATLGNKEDEAVNAGYAIWSEFIAELIAAEKDMNCIRFPLSAKEGILRYDMDELEDGDRKRAVSMILCEALTSKESAESATWDAAKKEIARYKPFDDPVFMDLLELVVRKLEVNDLEIDREFIHELGALYLFLDEQLDIRKLQKRLTGENRA